ncbi:MAG: hypothetical protein HY788_01710 [Deltaproteobacteria bacterium]|nr:hypothetical protein [Deltaproteobacteria bacterium]
MNPVDLLQIPSLLTQTPQTQSKQQVPEGPLPGVEYTEAQKKKLREAEDIVSISNVALDISRGLNYAARDEGNKTFGFSVDPEKQAAFMSVENGGLWTAFNSLSLLNTQMEETMDPGFVSTSYFVSDAGSDDPNFEAHRGPFPVKNGPLSRLHAGYQLNTKGLGKTYL